MKQMLSLILWLTLPGYLVVQPLQAQTLTTLYSFKGSPDGAWPVADLVLDAQGNLYGTTYYGGRSSACPGTPGGCGTVYKLTPTGVETVLHSFPGTFSLSKSKVRDGIKPWAGVVFDGQGNLYGSTQLGYDSVGTVFELAPSNRYPNRYRVIYQFSGLEDGNQPLSDLVLDAQGNLYGTTALGGDFGNGTVFRVTPTGTETVLHSFSGLDGAAPFAGLVRDAQGNLYGTTLQGGTFGNGTVFRVTPTGTETVLHSFAGTPDGARPRARLFLDAEGNLFGTSSEGGTFGNGTVYQVTSTGSEKVLYSFSGGNDGSLPLGGLIQDVQGNLYGTTSLGDPSCAQYSCGTIFKLTSTGTETVLYRFTGGADGGGQVSGLVRDSNGNLYGITHLGGIYGYGTVFRLTP